jgi:hypothetical protein
MADTYHDDLETTLAWIDTLEREAERLRKRNAELESFDSQTVEARENAQKLEADLEREREALRDNPERVEESRHDKPLPRPAPVFDQRELKLLKRAAAVASLLVGASVAGAVSSVDSSPLAACGIGLIVCGIVFWARPR